MKIIIIILVAALDILSKLQLSAVTADNNNRNETISRFIILIDKCL